MAKKSTQQYLKSINLNEKLISSIDNGIIILNDQLKIIYFNKWLELHTSIKEKDILGLTLTNVFTRINEKTLKRKIKTALRMGTPTFYSATITKYLIPIKINQIKVSDFLHMRQDVSVVPFDIENNLVAIIITDQTSMINIHNLLEANIQKVQDLNLELVQERETIDKRVILLKINTQNVIRDVSQAYLELLEFKKEDILTQNIFDYERLSLDSELEDQIIQSIEEKKVFKYEKISISSNGKEIWLLNTLVPEYNQNGEHIGFIIFGENITSSKLVQEHQEKLLENSRTAAMGEMISMIAHQWRQPLSVINTIIATLKIKKELNILSDEIIVESHNKIETTINYLSDTIDDFRNFFKKNKELKTISVRKIFSKSNNLLQSEMNLHNIQYTEEIDENILLTTYQNELVQTLINVIKNSIDAFKENIKEFQYIQVVVSEHDTHIELNIKDNAGGIPEDVLLRVFEPYFSTKSKNGTGLGLYVCKTIIEEHLRGKITMRTNEDTTTTIIELPSELIIPDDEDEVVIV